MKIIQLMGAPGSGKSTAASGLFYLMKMQGLNVELVTEYAKDLVWEDNRHRLKDQVSMLARQNERLERLRDKVDYVITDSPLMLGILYINPKATYKASLEQLTMDLSDTYDTVNYMIKRAYAFNPIGRLQKNDIEVNKITKNLYALLDRYNIEYKTIESVSIDDFDESALNLLLTDKHVACQLYRDLIESGHIQIKKKKVKNL